MSAELVTMINEVIDEAMLRNFVEARTAVPGNVVAYRGSGVVGSEYVKVELGLKGTLRDGRNLTLPEVDRVPILWPGGNGFHSGIELAKGDGVFCVVSDRAIDSWLQAGGVQAPTNGRLHDITDIVALPGLRASKQAVTVQRGAGTWYIGTDSGAAPWLRLQKTPATATVEAPTIRLGEAATRGVARANDSCITSANPADPWNVWFTALGALISTPPPFIDPIATILTSSSKAFSE